MHNISTSYFPHVTEGWKHLHSRWKKPIKLVDCKNSFSFSSVNFRKPMIAAAMVIYALVNPIFIAFDTLYTKVCPPTKLIKLDGGCDNLFLSGLFDIYCKMIQKAFQNELNLYPSLKDLIDNGESPEKKPEKSFFEFSKYLLMDPSLLNNLNSRKNWFRNTTTQLRYLIKELDSNESDECKNISNLLMAWMVNRYLETDLLDNIHNLIDTYDKKNDLSELESLYEKIEKDSELKNDGNIKDLLDTHLFGNVPFSLPQIILNGKPLKMIRMPSVTKDLERIDITGIVKKTAIIEEFSLFLKGLAQKGQKHLYVNLMNRRDGNEAIRSAKIEKLDKSRDNITILTLDKSSSFYQQTHKFSANNMNAIEFKKMIMNRIFDPNGYFFIPEEIKQSAVKSIIDNIHQNNFSNNDILTKDDRQNFIELVYIRLIEHVATSYDITSMNISCKSCIDRGSSLNFTFLSQMNKEKKVGSISDKQLISLLLSPAVMVSNRPIQKHYFDRSILYLKSMIEG